MRPKFDYTDFQVFQKSQKYNLEIHEFLKNTKLDKAFKDQLRRASFSIMLNIAEGNSRRTTNDRRNFFVIARSSAIECAAIVEFLELSEQIDQPVSIPILEKLSELCRMLFPFTEKKAHSTTSD
ncbi:MAG: four helix bundle protein [Cyclobacteriaceae bacterium]|nr:four helix bundle protein [Cyclobacteriaceae bacterium]